MDRKKNEMFHFFLFGPINGSNNGANLANWPANFGLTVYAAMAGRFWPHTWPQKKILFFGAFDCSEYKHIWPHPWGQNGAEFDEWGHSWPHPDPFMGPAMGPAMGPNWPFFLFGPIGPSYRDPAHSGWEMHHFLFSAVRPERNFASVRPEPSGFPRRGSPVCAPFATLRVKFCLRQYGILAVPVQAFPLNL